MAPVKISVFINKIMITETQKNQIIEKYHEIYKNIENYCHPKEKGETVVGIISKELNLNKEYIKPQLRKNNLTIYIPDFLKEKIIEDYKKCYNIVHLLLIYPFNRTQIDKLLIEENIHHNINEESRKQHIKQKVKKSENTCLKKYNVKNIGETLQYGRSVLNKIPYKKTDFIDSDLKEYKEAVIKNQIKFHNKNAKNNQLPNYCEYTGIQFSDAFGEKCNPNDPCKRSIDHKHPIILCFFEGWTIEECSNQNNLIYCLKYLNTIKGTTSHEDFILLAEKIREKFINENYKYI